MVYDYDLPIYRAENVDGREEEEAPGEQEEEDGGLHCCGRAQRHRKE